MAGSERRQGGGRVGVTLAKISVEHVVLVRGLHQGIGADENGVDIQLCDPRAQVGHAVHTEHAVHGPVTHVRAVEEVIPKVELLHPEQTLRFVCTARHVNQPRERLASQTGGNNQRSLPCPRQGPGSVVRVLVHTPRPRPTTVRQRGVRGGTILAGNREPRERLVNFVRHILLLICPVLRGQREANFDDRGETISENRSRLEESFAVVVLLGQPCPHCGPAVGEH
eukprot:scaffold52825_cov70-Phaeocystis_antarctica.AAC.1